MTTRAFYAPPANLLPKPEDEEFDVSRQGRRE
jgi:hypothetical protein